MKKSELQRATQLLKDLEEHTHISACNVGWTAQREDFLLTMGVVRTASQIIILYRQLRQYAISLMTSKLSEDWSSWKRKYWMFMTDPDLNIKRSIFRLIISMRFLQEELDPLAFDDSWNSGKKEEWLQESEKLVYPLSRIKFHVELLMNADELMKQFRYLSFSDYRTQNSQLISDIKTAADKLESSTVNASIVRIAGGGMRISGGAAGLAVTFAPVSGGLSVALCLGAGGFITTQTSKYYQERRGKETVIEIYEKILKLSPETQAVNELLRNVSVEEILKVQRALSSLSQERGSTLYQYARTKLQEIMRKVPKFDRQVRLMNTFLKIIPRTDNLSYSTVAQTYLSLQTIYYGINDMVVGVKQIKNGSELVKMIRKLSDTLETHTTAHFNSYDEARKSCEEYLVALEPQTPTISSQILLFFSTLPSFSHSTVIFIILSLLYLYLIFSGKQEDFLRISEI